MRVRGDRDRRAVRSFVYVSEAKLRDYLTQIDDAAKQSILDRLQPSFGFNIPPFSLSAQLPKTASRSVRDRSRDVQVAVAEEIIQEQFGIGNLAAGDYWIAGRADMDMDRLADRETVLFCGYAGPLLVALYGSVGHLTGGESTGPRLGSYSYAVRTALLDGDDPEHLGERLAVAAREMLKFAPQPVRFLAQVRKRGLITGGGHQREFVLATPLYVAEAHLRDESPHTPMRGRVHWVSADQGWGLIAPAGEMQDGVVYEVSTAPDGVREPLALGDSVEFRVTHGTAGIVATSVRALDAQALGAADPRSIGGYEVLRRLGDGSMGVVYLARDAGGQLAAIKKVRPELAHSPEFLRRFQAEADSASRVRGPNVARLIAAVTDGAQPYLVTEFVDGPTLEKQVKQQHGPLPLRSAIETAAGVAAALEVIHQAGIIHRDLAPSNVILSSSGPVVIDFGIARALGASTRHTQVGLPVGTPAYMSPEQVKEEALTRESDIFSWAGVTVFAVTGHQPFASEDSPVDEIWRMIREGDPDLRGVPRQLRKVLLAALSKDPARRPTASEVSHALKGQLAEFESRPRKPAARWLRVAIVGALAAAAAVIATFVVKVDLSPGGGPQACPVSKLAGVHQVTGPASGAAADGNLDICPVQVDHGQAPGLTLTLSGTILGQIPSGQVLIVVSQPDPGSCDTSGNPGTGGYYLIGPVIRGSRGEWTVTSGPSYSGGESIQRHLYFLLWSQAAVNAFKNAQAGSGGAPSWTTSADENFHQVGSFTFTPVQPPNRYCPSASQ
jgi:predicted Ser/Thr protein kinase/cold shock CspA family protein